MWHKILPHTYVFIIPSVYVCMCVCGVTGSEWFALWACKWETVSLSPTSDYGVYPSSFSPALISCECPPNIMPPVHPAENGYLEFPGCKSSLQYQLWSRWDFGCPHHLLRRGSQSSCEFLAQAPGGRQHWLLVPASILA